MSREVADESTTDPGGSEADDVLARVRRRLFAGAVRPVEARGGRYELIEKIGEGGMGVVWRARDPALDRMIAVKVVRTTSHRTQARLLAEGRALARLSHPNVVQIYEVDEREGEVFLAMEYVRGQTLREWARDQPWDVIVGVLAQAGRGLAATHACGIAHRDFKPENVLVDGEGRAKVLDFGLARHVDGDATTPSQLVTLGEESPAEQTRTGTLAGTPAYMSPEQFRGRRGDARSDQYSFCVTLYEALHGARPFAGFGDELRRNVVDGRRIPPPVDSPAPAYLLAVLDRGLRLDPAARWADMDALLAALEDAPLRRRARWRRLGVVALGLATATALWAWRESGPAPCSGAYQRLEGVWDPERRAAVEQAIMATHVPFARDSAAAVVATLDGYAHRWARAHTGACEATHRRGEQSEAMLDERMRCLTGRLHELAAVSQVLQGTDSASVHTVLEVAQRLPDVDGCEAPNGESSRLFSPAALPAVEAQGARLAQVQALWHAGRALEGYRLAEDVAQRAEIIGDDRLMAEATYYVGLLATESADYARGEASLLNSHLAAERLGMHALARDSAWGLGTTVGHVQERVAEGERWATIAEAKAAFIADPVAQGRVAMLRANLASTRGDPRMALQYDQEAAERLVRALGPDHLDVAKARVNLGISLAANGDRSGAQAVLEQVLAVLERTLGPDHPRAALVHNELGKLAAGRKHHDEAARRFEHALAIWTRVHEASHIDVALALRNLGVVENRRGRPQRALQHLTRALAIRESKLGLEHSETISTVQAIANIDREQGRLDRARVGYRHVLAVRERIYGAAHPSLVTPLVGLALIAEQTDDLERAMALAERAEGIQVRSSDPTPLGELTLLLGRLLLPTQPARALEGYERGARRIEEVFGPDHPDLAELRARHAEALVTQGVIAQAPLASASTRAVGTP